MTTNALLDALGAALAQNGVNGVPTPSGPVLYSTSSGQLSVSWGNMYNLGAGTIVAIEQAFNALSTSILSAAPPPPPPPPPPPVTSPGSRTYLTGPATYYVSNSGSDAIGDGSSAHPWATLAHAYNWCRDALDLGGQKVTISVPASYVGSTTCVGPMTGQVLPSDFSFVGAGPGSCSIGNPAAGNCLFLAQEGARFGVRGATLSSGGFGIVCSDGVIEIGNLYFNTMTNSSLDAASPRAQIYLKAGDTLTWLNGQSFTSAATAEDHGMIILAGTLTISGSPTFTGAFLQSDLGGMIDYSACTINPGSAVGKQFNALSFGLVFSGNAPGTPCALPGNAAGTVSGGYFQ